MAISSHHQAECVCGYCTCALEGAVRVYRHQKGHHPEPRPAFCSTRCMGYYDNRAAIERRTFIDRPRL